MGFKNPYIDNYDHHLTSRMITSDGRAYRHHPALRHLYDKLWVARSQGLACGSLEKVADDIDRLPYPIFIKPRYGHLTACSRNCHKVKDSGQLLKYINYPSMMWSEYIDGTEGMTDYIMLNGSIVNQLTYVYSPEQRGNVEVWKLISSDTKAHSHITAWVKENVENHTGFVNVQYRDGKIIEVGLRPARAGAYHIIADNPAISENIFNLFHKSSWDEALDMSFKPYYSFKCFTSLPVVTLWPDFVLNLVCSCFPGILLHEYYFEPVGTKGIVYLQFAHPDKEAGNSARRQIELAFAVTQLAFISLILLLPVIVLVSSPKVASIYAVILTLVLATRFLNPIGVQTLLWRAQLEKFYGKNSLTTQEQFDQR